MQICKWRPTKKSCHGANLLQIAVNLVFRATTRFHSSLQRYFSSSHSMVTLPFLESIVCQAVSEGPYLHGDVSTTRRSRHGHSYPTYPKRRLCDWTRSRDALFANIPYLVQRLGSVQLGQRTVCWGEVSWWEDVIAPREDVIAPPPHV